ncbi:MAG: hypothetical protein OES20_16555 [Gammaproteobacteria bacterium]|nr:hypothetical protein [Gammaproteobacteria bacterium]
MNDDTTDNGIDKMDNTDTSLPITYTQVASCAIGNDRAEHRDRIERRRQTLRAKLEREAYERQKQLENSFIQTFRNIFSTTKH